VTWCDVVIAISHKRVLKPSISRCQYSLVPEWVTTRVLVTNPCHLYTYSNQPQPPPQLNAYKITFRLKGCESLNPTKKNRIQIDLIKTTSYLFNYIVWKDTNDPCVTLEIHTLNAFKKL